MLGIQDTDEPHKKLVGEMTELVPQQQEHCTKRINESDLVFEATANEMNQTSESTGAREVIAEHVEVDWNKFKEEFSATLQTSQEKLSMEQSNEVHVADDLSRKAVHEQLLINAIAMMHSTAEQEEQMDPSASSQSFSVSGSSVTHKLGELSPLRQRKRLLSQGTLETIHESEIDKVLDMADVPYQQDYDTKENRKPPIEGPPLPKFVWDNEDKSEDDLMKELEQLSFSQTRESSSVGGHNDVISSYIQGMLRTQAYFAFI